MRAVIYTRQPEQAAGDGAADLAAQETRCRQYAAERGYTIVEVFHDVPGDVMESRPELRRLRQAIWRRRLDVVIATSPDCLYFDTNRLVRFAREAVALGVRLEFPDVHLELDDLEILAAEQPEPRPSSRQSPTGWRSRLRFGSVRRADK